jgi:hypothetical protein
MPYLAVCACAGVCEGLGLHAECCVCYTWNSNTVASHCTLVMLHEGAYVQQGTSYSEHNVKACEATRAGPD